MIVLNCRNVNDGFVKAMDLIAQNKEYTFPSRAGEVIEVPQPVATVYGNSKERVLFEDARNANPFFHLIESLWMLGGCNDLEYIEYYNKRMSQFSDDGETLQGSYGFRWREHFGGDQLGVIIERLRNDPTDRRCVLQMWDPYVDFNTESVDVPCNTAIYFKVRDGKLDMTVSNRSNDVIWGAFGANVVHMSILQEYMAYGIGVEIGTYTQVSDSLHAYTDLFYDMYNQMEAEDAFDFYSQMSLRNPYDNKAINSFPLISTDIITWEQDLTWFLCRAPMSSVDFADPFFSEVAVPLQDAWYLYKSEEYDEALIEVQSCLASDWGTAAYNWLNKSISNKGK